MTKDEIIALARASGATFYPQAKDGRPAVSMSEEVLAVFSAALTAQPAAPAVVEWQPIKTAPRDGSALLVMRNIWPGTESGCAETCNGHNTYVAQWWAGERGGTGAWVCYMDAVQDPECPVDPTHWMPLPTPPESTPS